MARSTLPGAPRGVHLSRLVPIVINIPDTPDQIIRSPRRFPISALPSLRIPASLFSVLVFYTWYWERRLVREVKAGKHA